MSPEEAVAILNRVRLRGAVLTFGHEALGLWRVPSEFPIRISIKWKDRSGSNDIQVDTVQTITLYLGLTERDLLSQVQAMWTSMFMHESLETFVVDDTLPFDPHCTTAWMPRPGSFFRDNQCTTIQVPKDDPPPKRRRPFWFDDPIEREQSFREFYGDNY